MKEEMQVAINAQIQKEFYSSYLYLAMSAYCEKENFVNCNSKLNKNINP